MFNFFFFVVLLQITLHDVVHLLELVGQPLLAAELVLIEVEDELLVVLDGVLVELVQRAVQVELVGVQARFFRQHRVHVLIGNDRHGLDVGVIPVHPVFVDWNVFGVEEL